MNIPPSVEACIKYLEEEAWWKADLGDDDKRKKEAEYKAKFIREFITNIPL